MVRVKICGITSLEDAMTAVEAGADALGFIFVEKTPRFVTPERVAPIVQKLQPIEWTVARELGGQQWRIILSAGLTPENVGRAVATARPYAVDVNSGVEAEPGRKDPDKVWRFVAEAKGTR